MELAALMLRDKIDWQQNRSLTEEASAGNLQHSFSAPASTLVLVWSHGHGCSYICHPHLPGRAHWLVGQEGRRASSDATRLLVWQNSELELFRSRI